MKMTNFQTTILELMIGKEYNNTKMRRWIHKKNPHCIYCGVLTIRPNGYKMKTGERPPDNYATLEHIYPKTDLRRYCIGGNKLAIACTKCNSRKGGLDGKLTSPNQPFINVFKLLKILT